MPRTVVDHTKLINLTAYRTEIHPSDWQVQKAQAKRSLDKAVERWCFDGVHVVDNTESLFDFCSEQENILCDWLEESTRYPVQGAVASQNGKKTLGECVMEEMRLLPNGLPLPKLTWGKQELVNARGSNPCPSVLKPSLETDFPQLGFTYTIVFEIPVLWIVTDEDMVMMEWKDTVSRSIAESYGALAQSSFQQHATMLPPMSASQTAPSGYTNSRLTNRSAISTGP